MTSLRFFMILNLKFNCILYMFLNSIIIFLIILDQEIEHNKVNKKEQKEQDINSGGGQKEIGIKENWK